MAALQMPRHPGKRPPALRRVGARVSHEHAPDPLPPQPLLLEARGVSGAPAKPRHRDDRQGIRHGAAVGVGAWSNRIGAVRGGAGSSHGSWSNAMVGSECKSRAAEYFREIAGWHPQEASSARALASDFAAIAGCLKKAGDKGLEAEHKIEVLEEARRIEAACIERMREVWL